MSEEWQPRQLLLIASAPGPGKGSRPSGRLTLTGFGGTGALITDDAAITGSRRNNAHAAFISSSSHHRHRCGFNDVAHEAGRVPVGRVGLSHAVAVGAADHQRAVAACWSREMRLPAPEAVLALVAAKLGRLPGLPAVSGKFDFRHTSVAAEGNAANGHRSSVMNLRTPVDVGDE